MASSVARHHGHRPRWRSALLAPPATATARVAARQLGGLLWVLAAMVLLALLLADDDETPAAVAVPVALLLSVVGTAMVRWHRLTRAGVHAAIATATAVMALLAVATPDVQLSSAYAGGLVLVLVVAAGVCSWWQMGLHLLPALVLLIGRQLVVVEREWSATVVELVVLVVTTAFAGHLVRAAATAEVDPLTGLLNRRGAQRRLLDLSAATGRAGSVCVALLDLDSFKQLNDTAGHAAGDALLREVAQALSGAVQRAWGTHAQAHIARWGGDEFLIVARATGAELVEVLDWARGELPPGAGFSAGVAPLVAGGAYSEALAQADRALYRVKRSTRGATALVEQPAAALEEVI